MRKEALILHSGGMDSSLCLALACREFGLEQVLSVSFAYHQRHQEELIQAASICRDWGVDHVVFSIDCLKEMTQNALIDSSIPIEHPAHQLPNTLVTGRNGLMVHLGGIHAEFVGARCLYMGIMELEGANSGYHDCSRKYMDLQQELLRLDLNHPTFEIRTPLVRMTKKQTLDLADRLGILTYLLRETITCYEGVREAGCRKCPACLLRNQGIQEFLQENPTFSMPFAV